MSEKLFWIEPDWSAPPGVRAVTTTRQGGFSGAPFNSLNLADHVGDDPVAVMQNRDLLRSSLGLAVEPCWLTQVHGCNVVDTAFYQEQSEADAGFAKGSGKVCAVLTADCLPILLCDRKGTQVAAVHAGWRGLAAGVIGATLRCFSIPGQEIRAWLGPAIGPQAFEVGDEVREIFVRNDSCAAEAFIPYGPHRWLANIYQLAHHQLAGFGIDNISGGDCCTVTDTERFFSYRRDGKTGRMASLIWIEKQD